MAGRRGKFIVIEGGDGSGKSTATNYLKEELNGRRVLFTREPGGTPLGISLRQLILESKMDATTELFLFCADRCEHVQTVILPAIQKGVHVICDRFDASTYAYQIYARGENKNKELFDQLNANITKDVRPDCYIFLDVPSAIAIKRMKKREGKMSRFDREKLAFHKRVGRGYQQFLADVPHVVIDSSSDIAAMKDVLRKTVASIIAPASL